MENGGPTRSASRDFLQAILRQRINRAPDSEILAVAEAVEADIWLCSNGDPAVYKGRLKTESANLSVWEQLAEDANDLEVTSRFESHWISIWKTVDLSDPANHAAIIGLIWSFRIYTSLNDLRGHCLDITNRKEYLFFDAMRRRRKSLAAQEELSNMVAHEYSIALRVFSVYPTDAVLYINAWDLYFQSVCRLLARDKNQSDPILLEKMGTCHFFGIGVIQSYDTAAMYYEGASLTNMIRACKMRGDPTNQMGRVVLRIMIDHETNPMLSHKRHVTSLRRVCREWNRQILQFGHFWRRHTRVVIPLNIPQEKCSSYVFMVRSEEDARLILGRAHMISEVVAACKHELDKAENAYGEALQKRIKWTHEFDTATFCAKKYSSVFEYPRFWVSGVHTLGLCTDSRKRTCCIRHTQSLRQPYWSNGYSHSQQRRAPNQPLNHLPPHQRLNQTKCHAPDQTLEEAPALESLVTGPRHWLNLEAATFGATGRDWHTRPS
jgi:hypothetical protein